MADELIVSIKFEADRKSRNDAFAGLEKGAEKAGGKAGDGFKKGFGKSAKGLGAGFGKQFGVSITNLAKTIIGAGGIVAAVRGLTNAVRESFQGVRDFSRATAEVNSILKANEKLTAQTTDTFRDFAATFGTDSARQAKAFYSIVSGGVKGTANQLELLKVANQAAIAGLVDIDTSAKALVSSINAYRKAGLTAQQASDALFVAVREGQTTFAELSQFLGNTSSIAASAGVTFEELTGAVAAVTKGGIETSKATIALRGVLAALIKPTKEAQQTAADLGLDFSTAAVRAKGFAGFLKDVGQATGGSEKALAKLFGNVRGLTAILKVVNGDFDDFVRIQKEVQDASGATAAAAKDIRNSLDFNLSQLGSQFKQFGRDLLSGFTPAINAAVNGLRNLGEAFFLLRQRADNQPIPLSPLKAVDKQIKETEMSIKRLQERVKGSAKIALISGKSEILIRRKLLEELKTADKVLIGLRKQRAAIVDRIEKNSAENQKNTNDKKNQDLLNSDKLTAEQRRKLQVDALQNFRELNILTTQSIAQEEARRTEIIQEAFNTRAINRQSYNEAIANLDIQAATQRQQIEDQVTQASIANFFKAENAVGSFFKKYKLNAIEAAKITQNFIAKGLGNSFFALGKALREGASASVAFRDALYQQISDLASAFGDFFIKKGIAISADPTTPGGGASLIAAGVALKTLGGFIGGKSGGGGGAGTGGGETSAPDISADNQFLEDQEAIDEQRNGGPNVQLVVQGDILDSEDTGNRLVELLNSNFENRGGTLNEVSFA